MTDLQNKIVGVIGRKGSGKSTVLRRILQRCPRFLVVDTMGEHSWVPNRFFSLEETNRFLCWAETQDKFAGAFIPQENLEENLATLAPWVYDQGGMVLALEEVPMYVTAAYVPNELDRVVRLGRHHQVSLLYTGQRAAEIARRLTAASDGFVLFQHTEPRDLDAIAQRCGGDVADRVSGLGLHAWLYWDAITRRVSGDGNLPRI